MTLILTFIILVAAFTGQSAVGFGGGMLAIPLLCFLYTVKEAVTLYLFFQIFEIFLIIKSHQHIDWGAAKRIIPVTLVFVLIGAFSLSYFSENLLRGVLSVIIVSYLVKEIFWKSFNLQNKKSTIFAFLSGGLGGLPPNTPQGLLG